MTFDDMHNKACTLSLQLETEQDTSKMLLTVSSFGESLRRLSTGGGVFNNQYWKLKDTENKEGELQLALLIFVSPI